MQIVILQKGHPAADQGGTAQLQDGPERLLGFLVLGVGLAGNHDLDGLGVVRQQPHAALEVTHEQVETLVRRHASREADREHSRVEHPHRGACSTGTT